MKRPVSAVLIARNEAHRLSSCLLALAWADEIILVDSGSTDSTLEVARRYTDKVFEIPWRGFGPQKQAAVELASHDWILNVDCDELVTPELAEEIQALLDSNGLHNAYSVPRRTFVGSKEIKYCGWYPDRTVRLFDRTKAHFSDNQVHERVVVDAPIGEIRHPLLHYSFSGLRDMIPKLNQYSDLSAEQMFAKGQRCHVIELFMRPFAAFFKTYILKLGILDGFEGIVISATTSFLTFAKYAKLREKQRAGYPKDMRQA